MYVSRSDERRSDVMDAVDVFSAGVDHADGKEVFSGFSYAVCHIELKRRFAALIGAETAAVQPHLRHVVHNAEA